MERLERWKGYIDFGKGKCFGVDTTTKMRRHRRPGAGDVGEHERVYPAILRAFR